MTDLDMTCHLNELGKQFEAMAASASSSTRTFGVEYEGIIFPILVNYKPQFKETLTCLYNGAVSRSRSENGIVFQRSSWQEEIGSAIIGFADPTIPLNDGMSLGWGQTDGHIYAPEVYAKIAAEYRHVVGCTKPETTLHYGSSAGGYQAVATATFDKGSHALANNPQLDWSRYSITWAANRALGILGYSDRNAYVTSDNYEEIAWRVELPQLFRHLGRMPSSLRLLVNAASKSDITDQLENFNHGVHEVAGDLLAADYTIQVYFNEAQGHNPLSKPRTIAEISKSLNSFTA